MNVTTQVRRSSIASTLAVAALVIAACGTEEASPEAPESMTEGSIELGVTPNPVTFNDAGEYLVELERDGERAEAKFTLKK